MSTKQQNPREKVNSGSTSSAEAAGVPAQPGAIAPWLYWSGLAVLLAAMVVAPGALRKPSAIVIEPSVQDLGKVPQAEKLTARFVVTNTHDEPVELIEVRPSCGCTVVEPLPRTLAAGARTELVAQLNTGTSQGATDSHIAIIYRRAGEANEAERAQCSIVAQIEPEFVVTPRSLDFGTIAYPARKTKSIVLKGVRCRDLDIKEVRSSHAAFTSKTTKLPHDPSRWRVDVHCVPRTTDRDLIVGVIDLITNSTRRPVTRIVVRAGVFRYSRFGARLRDG